MAATPNLTRKTLVVAKVESTYNTDAFGGSPLTSGASSCAQLLWDEVNPLQADTTVLDQQVVRASFSKYTDLVGRQLYNLRPKTMLMNTPGGSHVNTGSISTGDDCGDVAQAGKPPFFGHLLRACALQETISASTHVIYTPRSSGFESASAYVWADGLRHKITGMFGTLVIEGRAGEGVDLSFDMKGSYYNPESNAIPSSVTYPSDGKILVENESLTMGAFTGTPIVRSFRFDLGVNIIERRDMNSSKGLYGLWPTDRRPTLDLVIEVENSLSAYNPWTELNTQPSETDSITFTHGSGVGSRCQFAFTAAQLRDVQYQDDSGIRTYALSYNLTSTSDDAEYSIKFF